MIAAAVTASRLLEARSSVRMPAFPGQRPPFAPGHALSVRHGAYAREMRLLPEAAPVAESIAAQLDEVGIDSGKFAAAIAAVYVGDGQVIQIGGQDGVKELDVNYRTDLAGYYTVLGAS